MKCSGCRLVFCSKCDEKQHSENLFCHHTLHFKESERWIKSQSLLPTQFLNCLDGTVESKGYTLIAFIPCVFFIGVSNYFFHAAVPVPLFPAGPCPNCLKVGVLGDVVVASNSKAHWCSVVTKDGNLKLFFNS